MQAKAPLAIVETRTDANGAFVFELGSTGKSAAASPCACPHGGGEEPIRRDRLKFEVRDATTLAPV
jgi:hypothetical protein